MISQFADKIFFYCYPQGPPERAAYQHSIVCLAEGLRDLGIQFYSNINYWRISPEKEEYLFCCDPRVTPDDCSVVILDSDWCSYNKPLPEKLFRPNRKYITVYFDRITLIQTHAWSPEFRQFDFIFRPHYNNKCQYPSNFYPWAFGISDRILHEIGDVSNFQERKRTMLINFRCNHPLRKIIHKEFIPLIQKNLSIDDSTDSIEHPPMESYHYLQWAQTGRRHYPNYYKRLKKSTACACFGGRFMPPWPRELTAPLRLWHRVMNKLAWGRLRPIVVWDSWRFWESLAAGCVTFHVDFEKYGPFIPVMPENWRHYIGIDLENMQETVGRISDDPGILEKISNEGRIWALENYSPVPTALRFLETVLK